MTFISNFKQIVTPDANNTNFSIDLKGIPFGNGLFFVLSGANENVTVIYE